MPSTPVTEDLVAQTERNKLAYPDPFFDLARNYVPNNIKILFKFCRTYFYTSGFIRNVVTKLTEYPITDILYDATIDSETRDQWDIALHQKQKIKSFLIEVGLDYFTFGNAFISSFRRPTRFLKCLSCGKESPIAEVKFKLEKFKFKGTCPQCKASEVFFSIKDEYIASIDNFKFIRWAPENIDIEYNPLTGTSIYYYKIPNKIKSAILAGNKAVLAEVPEIFLDSLRQKKKIILDTRNLYHFKRPTLAEDDMGWGKPIILPALKEIYYLQTLRRGNEAIANEHVVPKKAVFPANTTTLDPYSMHPDTLVKSEGQYIKLKDVVNTRMQSLTTMNSTGNNIVDFKEREIEEWDYMLDITSFGLTGVSTKVNSVHPFRVWNSESETHEWGEAKNISSSDYTAFPVRSFNNKASKEMLVNDWGNKYRNGTQKPRELWKTAEFLRVLGLYIAEGCVSDDGLISFSFHTKEEDYYKYVEGYLDKVLPNSKCNYNVRGNSTEVRKQNVYLADFLRDHIGSNSHNKTLKFLDASYYTASEAIALLGGIYDGDGTFFYEKGKYPRLNLKSVNLGLLLEVRDILLSFKVYPTIVKDGSAYQLKLYNYEAERIASMFNYDVKGLYSKSGSKKVFFKDGFVYTKIQTVKEIDERTVLSVEVNTECHSYLSAGYINKNTQMNLGKWKGQIEEQLKKWKYDPNHIGVFPIPIGYQELGGNARALLLTPEMKFVEESIINSMGFPAEFIKGGATWTGSSISLRIVENHFLTYREQLEEMLNYFIVPSMVTALKYAPVKLKFKKFKMADDVQSKNLVLQMADAGKISDAKLLDEFGFDYEEETAALERSRSDKLEELIKQQEANAEAQGRAAVTLAKYQSRAQAVAAQESLLAEAELFQSELAQENVGIPDNPAKIIEKYAIEIMAMLPAQQEQILARMAKQMPVTYSMVIKRLQQMQLEQVQQQAFIEQSLAPVEGEGQSTSSAPKAEKTKGQTTGTP